MKKKIIIIMALLMIPFCFADAEVNMSVGTGGNMDSEIYQIALGNITTNLHCSANKCTTNINSGNININNDQEFNYNDYRTENIQKSGMTLRSFLYSTGKVLNDYVLHNKEKSGHTNAWDFWTMLDSIFVSHEEFEGTRQNTLYLLDEISALKAENKLLRTYLNITYNQELLECQTGIEKAKITGQKIITENGFKIDINAFGETCVRLY